MFRNQRQHTEARKYIREILRIQPDCREAYYELGLLFEREQNYHEALKNYLFAVEADLDAWVANNKGHAYYGIGNCLVYFGKADEAIVAYNESIKLSPEDPYPYNSVADLLYQKGYREEARRAWEKVIELDAGAMGQAARENLRKS